MFKQLPFEAKQSTSYTSVDTPHEYVFNTTNHEKLQSIGTYFKASYHYNSSIENEQTPIHISSENVDLNLCKIIDDVCSENSNQPKLDQPSHSFDLPSLVMSMNFIGLTEVGASLLSDSIPEAPYIYQLLNIEKLEVDFILDNNLLFEGIFDIYFKDMGMTVPQFLKLFKTDKIYFEKLKIDWDRREKAIPEDIHSFTSVDFFLSSIVYPENQSLQIMQTYKPHKIIFAIKDYQTYQLPQEIKNKIDRLSESFTTLSLNKLGSQGMPSGVENTLTKIFAAVKASGKIQFVQTLDISKNELLILPESIGDFFKLQTLDVSENMLSFLPENLSKLSHLTSLNVSRNRLSLLPEYIAKLSFLKHLNASRNALETLFKELGHLKSLEYLNVSQNELTALPATLKELENLKSLDAEYNKLTALPDGFDLLTKVQGLYLRANPLNDETEAIYQEFQNKAREAIEKLRLEGS